MQTSESKLAKQISDIQNLAKENKNVDVATLMLGALESHSRNLAPTKGKRAAYLVSIGIPPLGLLFALRYLFSDYDDAQQTAYACIALTFVSVGLVYFFSKVLLSSSGVTVDRLRHAPHELQQLSQ